MIKVAVCDDDESVREKLFAIIKGWFDNIRRPVLVVKFISGVNLLESHIRFDIIFLDIEMPNLNGIETARMLRKWDVNSKIIYVTNYEHYIKSSYKVHAFDYISKPVCENEICCALLEAVQYSDNARKKQKYAFETEEGTVTLDLDDIYYFEYSSRRVIINCSREKYISSYSLKELLEKFQKYDFNSPHKGFIVNMLYIKLIKGFDIFMENGSIIPLAQKRAAGFRVEFNNFLQSTFNKI
ncbi:MAG: LytTR family DNA-binding domain-containing protein [Muricomes sp.]